MLAKLISYEEESRRLLRRVARHDAGASVRRVALTILIEWGLGPDDWDLIAKVAADPDASVQSMVSYAVRRNAPVPVPVLRSFEGTMRWRDSSFAGRLLANLDPADRPASRATWDRLDPLTRRFVTRSFGIQDEDFAAPGP